MKGIIERSIPKILTGYNEAITERVKMMMVPVVDVGMKRDLWGLTLWLCSFMIQMGVKKLKTD